MQGFHDANKYLPFNGTGPAIGSDATSGSCFFQILPYIDANPWYAEWYADPEAAKAQKVSFAWCMCPGRGRNNSTAWTDYFYNNYLNDPMQAAKPNAIDARRSMKDITDGTSHTIFVGHGNIRISEYGLAANVAMSSNIFLGGTTGTMRSGDNGNNNPTGVTLACDSD